MDRSAPEPEHAGRGFGETFALPMLFIFPIPLLALLLALGPMSRAPELHDQAWLVQSLSLALLGTSMGAIILVAGCVACSLRSQRMQYLTLRLGWMLLRPIGIFQLIGQGTLAVALSYYAPAVLFGIVMPKLVIALGIAILIAIVACIRAAYQAPLPSDELQGRRLDPKHLGRLGDRLQRICGAMGQRMPDNIIVGIDDNFFVTESPISIAGTTYRGRTLFLSLPLLGRLGLEEASAVFAHEMAHFSGNDTVHGQRIGELLNGFNAQLRGMDGVVATPIFRFMLFFRALFELSLGKVSREREFRADRIAAQLVDRKPLALALAKVSAFCSFRARLEFALFNSLRGLADGGIPARIATGFERFVAEADFAEDILGNHAPHPFDRHPTLEDRLASIGLDGSVLRREEIAALPGETWRDAIADGAGIEASLWAAYESDFRAAHEELAAYRLRPDNEAEAAIVRAHFPDRVIEGDQNCVLAIDFACLSFSEWDAKIAFRDIRDVRLNESITGNTLVFTVSGRRRGRTYELALKRFGGKATEVTAMISAYYGRHLESLNYRASLPKQKAAAIAPPSTAVASAGGSVAHVLIPSTLAPGEAAAVEQVVVPAAAEQPTRPPILPPTAPDLGRSSGTRADPRPRLDMAAEPGVLNGRYEVLDEADDWEPARMQRCRDRKTGEMVLCVRVGVIAESPEALLARIWTAARLRIPGVLTPTRLVRARGYRPRLPGTMLAEGDVVLVLPDPGAQPVLAVRPKPGPAASALAGAMRILRPLGEILDACAANGVDLKGLEFDHIRLDPERRVVLYLLAPWLGRQDGAESDVVVDPTHPRAGDPATIVAAMSAVLLADPVDLRLHACHNGLHRTIGSLPSATNRLLSQQLAMHGTPPHPSADAFLDALQVSPRVHLEDYLDQRQIDQLRMRHGLDDDAILVVVADAVRRSRPGVDLMGDQTPQRVPQRDVDAALKSRLARGDEDRRSVRLQSIQRWLMLGAGVVSILAIAVWWFSNDGPEPVLQAPEGAGNPMVRATFTRDQSFNSDFPSRCYRHVPANRAKVAFYTQLVGVQSGTMVTLAVTDQNGTQINQYSYTLNDSSGWVCVQFLTSGRSDLTSVTGHVRVQGKQILELSLPVERAWSDGVGGIAMVLIGLWLSAMGTIWFIHRHTARRAPGAPP